MSTNDYMVIYLYKDDRGWGIGRVFQTGHNVTTEDLIKLENDIKKNNNFNHVAITNIINLNKL